MSVSTMGAAIGKAGAAVCGSSKAATGPKVTAAVLSRAIDAAQTAEMRERASTIGATMRTEDGLATAVDRVHALLARANSK